MRIFRNNKARPALSFFPIGPRKWRLPSRRPINGGKKKPNKQLTTVKPIFWREIELTHRRGNRKKEIMDRRRSTEKKTRKKKNKRRRLTRDELPLRPIKRPFNYQLCAPAKGGEERWKKTTEWHVWLGRWWVGRFRNDYKIRNGVGIGFYQSIGPATDPDLISFYFGRWSC